MPWKRESFVPPSVSHPPAFGSVCRRPKPSAILPFASLPMLRHPKRELHQQTIARPPQLKMIGFLLRSRILDYRSPSFCCGSSCPSFCPLQELRVARIAWSDGSPLSFPCLDPYFPRSLEPKSVRRRRRPKRRRTHASQVVILQHPPSQKSFRSFE